MHLTDIDECETREKVCQHTCMNTFGSFNCGCKPGFQLLDDGFTCEGNECTHKDHIHVRQIPLV